MIQMLHLRKSYLLGIFTTFMLWGSTAIGQITYTWVGSTNSPISLAANWSPVRTIPAADDILIFSNGAIQNVGVGTVTVGRVVVSNNTYVNFDPDDVLQTFSISNPGTALTIEAGSTLGIRGRNALGANSYTLNFAGAGNIVNIAGTLILDAPPVDNNDFGTYDATNSVTTVTGTLRNNGNTSNQGGNIISTASNLIFGATGIYQHARSQGSIPTATWNAGSNTLVTGHIGGALGGQAQTFSNLTWNSNVQTGLVLFSPGNVTENLVIQSTGTGQLLTGVTPRTFGNFIMSGGSLRSGSNNVFNVPGNVSISGGTLTMAHTAATSTMNVSGSFSHTAGTISSPAGIGAINFNGTIPQIFTGGGTVTGTVNYTVNNGATLQMNDAATVLNGAGFTLSTGSTLGIRSADGITLAPTTAGNIRTTTRSFGVAANYLYNGTAAQITGSGFPTNLTGDLIINNPGFTVTLDAEGIAADPRTIAAGGLVNLTAGTFAAAANLTLALGSEITRSEGTMTASVIGGTALDVYNITYTGSSKTTGNEFLGGQVSLPSRVNNVTVNLSAGQSLTMAAGIGIPFLGISGSAIAGTLTLTNGLVNTGLLNGILLTDAATISGAGPTRYINGPLAKSGSAAFVFPIGDGGLYLPLALSGAAAAPADFTTVLPTSSFMLVEPKHANAKLTYGSLLSAPLLSVSSCFYWNITRGTGSGDIHVWLPVDQKDFCFTTNVINADLRVAHLIGGPAFWTSAATQGATASSSGATFIGSANGFSAFSPFTLGSITVGLPVELTKFSAAKNGSAVKLSWTTASEQNNAYFNVERSADGVSYSVIGKVNGAINSSAVLNYSFNDNSPLAGKNFYRLRQVDLDGQFALSSIVSVNMSVNSSVSLYPNPVSNTALLQYPKAVKGAAYRVVAMDGRIMKSGILQENSTQMNLNLGGLQSGTYVLIINNNGEQYQQRIQKQ